MNTSSTKPIMTAPPELSQAPGFMQRAMAGNMATPQPADRSALPTPSSSSLGTVLR